MNLSFPLTLTDRFAWIIRELHAAVAARIRFPPVTGAIIVHICARLRTFAAEFSAVAEKIRSGIYVQRGCGGRRVARRTSRSPRPGPQRMHYELGLPPWQPGWLHRIAPGDAGIWAGALRTLLGEPDMVALISAVPKVRRILGPLCFMLGLEASLLRPSPPAIPGPAGEACDDVRPPRAADVVPACVPIDDAGEPPAACDTTAAGSIFRAA